MMRQRFVVLFLFLLFSSSPLWAGQLADLNPKVKSQTIEALKSLLPPKDATQDETKWEYTLDDVTTVALSLAYLGDDREAQEIVDEKMMSPWQSGVPYDVKRLKMFRSLEQSIKEILKVPIT